MGSRREKATLAAVLAVMLLVCFALVFLRNDYRFQIVHLEEVESTTGTWDLSDVDFSNTVVKIVGDVEYVEGAILTPDEFAAREGEALTGDPGYAYQALTSRIRLVMPEERTYALCDSSIDFAHRLFIDGEERFAAGVPAETADAFEPGYQTFSLEAYAHGGRIEVVQQAANFVHRESGGHDGILVGLPPVVHAFIDAKGDIELVTLGLFLALFLVNLALWAFFRSYKSNLIFALLSLVWAVRTGITGAKMLYEVFPMLPWEAAFRVEYLTLPLGCILVVLLVADQFPGVMRTWARRAALGASAAFALAFLVADTLWMSHALTAYYAVFTAIIVYLVVRFARTIPAQVRARTLTAGQAVALAALAVFMYAAVHDALYYLGIYLFGVKRALAEPAMLVFALFQMAANFHGTMREVAEARLREERAESERAALAQVNELKNGFYADLSHEMRTPLTVIAANAQFVADALEEGRTDGETVDDLRAVSAEARRLSQLVSSMVDVSRMQEGARGRATVSVEDLVRDTAQLYRSLLARRRNGLEVEVEGGLPEVGGDADQLVQVLVNLLANANRHTAHGTVKVRAERAEDGGVRVSVSDDGEGMDAATLSAAFERYARGDEAGSGLGLPICKGIVERHGGKMGIESEPGAGTQVWFTLPAAKEDAHG
ncbi:sensor histidine kinase [Arabiibacter massiliensis]|uniref:sensor histidine kinase n=1 Tax=Arabiibacter massiliensis TaxID=1870985 RepID=UPI0009B9FF26|nr:sensor histidine kinase [Arabiibacter massiliensis]